MPIAPGCATPRSTNCGPAARPVSPEEIAWLQTVKGVAAAEHATDLLASGSNQLKTIEALRRSLAPELARAALGLALGRAAASSKFQDAERLFCDRAAAEQASHELVARHTAKRLSTASRVADLGCGMGGDLIELARSSEVVAVDRDPTRLAMAAANATVRGLGDRTEFIQQDIDEFSSEGFDAAWFDPSRRDEQSRTLDPDHWSPSLSDTLTYASAFPGAGIKLAPGIDRDLLPEDAEVEFISLDGRLVAAILWLGTLAMGRYRATILTTRGAEAALSEEADAPPSVGAPGSYLYDPDPAIGRAQLIHRLAQELGAWQLDARIAYLSSDSVVSTVFARRFRVLASMPFSERHLLETLRELDAGRVEVMKRGSAIETNELARRLDRQLSGDRVLTIALTRIGTAQTAIVCERERDPGSGDGG